LNTTPLPKRVLEIIANGLEDIVKFDLILVYGDIFITTEIVVMRKTNKN